MGFAVVRCQSPTVIADRMPLKYCFSGFRHTPPTGLVAGREEAVKETVSLQVSICLMVFFSPTENAPCTPPSASPTASALLLQGWMEVGEWETGLTHFPVPLSRMEKMSRRREGIAFVRETKIQPRQGGRFDVLSVFLTEEYPSPSRTKPRERTTS